nr:uncharacterized protein LOC115495581 [Taeniopygia guttata]
MVQMACRSHFRRLRGLLRLSQDPPERTCSSSSSAGPGAAQGVSVRQQGFSHGRKTMHRGLAAEFPTSAKHHTNRAQLLPFAGATRVSWPGAFRNARCALRGGAEPRVRTRAALPPPGRPAEPRALPGPALHKRRSAADAAGALQGESPLLGTGGREGRRLLRAGGARTGRTAAPGTAAAGARRALSTLGRGRCQCTVFCGCDRIFISKVVSSQLNRPCSSIADFRVLAVFCCPCTAQTASRAPAAAPRPTGLSAPLQLPLGPGSAAHGKGRRCRLSSASTRIHEGKAADTPGPSSELVFPAFSILQGTPVYHSLIPPKE